MALPCVEAAGIVNQISFSLPKGSSVRERLRRPGREKEYYDETGESDGGGRIIYEAQNCPTGRHCTVFMHCLVQFSTLKSRPPLLEPPESVHVSLHLSPFSSHVRIKPHNNGENNRLPAALPRSLFLLLLPLALPFSPRLCSLDSNRAHYYNRQWPLSLSLSLSSHSLTS